MPIATFSLAIATLSLVGIPPLNVFFSKLLLFNAFLDRSLVLALVLVLSSATALIAYMRVFYVVWLRKPKENMEIKEPTSMSLICLLLALVVIIIGLMAPIITDKLITPAATQTMDYNSYVNVILNLASRVLH